MGYETDSIRNKNLALTTELGQVRAECQALRNEMAMMKQSMARVRSTPALTKTLAAGTIVISGPGVIYFDIDSTDSGALSVANYKQEMQIVTNGGLTYTVGQGVLRIKPEIIGA